MAWSVPCGRSGSSYIGWSASMDSRYGVQLSYRVIKEETLNPVSFRKCASFWVYRKPEQHPCILSQMELLSFSTQLYENILRNMFIFKELYFKKYVYIQEHSLNQSKNRDIKQPPSFLKYWSAINKSTSWSPVEIIYEWQLCLPRNLLFGAPPGKTWNQWSTLLRGEPVKVIHEMA